MNRSDKWLEVAKRCSNRADKVRMKVAALELGRFIDGPEGHTAIHQLLRVANHPVIFGKTTEVHPRSYVRVFALVGGPSGGLVMLEDESSGGIISVQHVSMKPISPETAVEVAVKYGHMEPEAIMPWLYDELDKIADSIP